jgi:hypothetical protein
MVVLKKTRSGDIFLLLFFLAFQKESIAFLSPLSTAQNSHRMTTTQTKALAQFAPEAVALFNNMKTPAAIIGGALVPLALLAPLPFHTPPGVEESRFKKSLRMLYSLVAVLSLASELLTVVWATVTTNKLIETTVAPAASVWYVGKYVKGWRFLVLMNSTPLFLGHCCSVTMILSGLLQMLTLSRVCGVSFSSLELVYPSMLPVA